MFNTRAKTYGYIVFFIDLLGVIISLFVCYSILYNETFFNTVNVYSPLSTSSYPIIVLICYFVVSRIFYNKKINIYKINFSNIVLNTFVITFIDVTFLYFIGWIWNIKIFSNKFVLLYGIFYWFLETICKWAIFKLYILFLTSKKNIRNILIVGTNRRAREYANSVYRNRILGFNLIGFIDDVDYSNGKCNLLGMLSDYKSIIRDNVIDAVFISLPIRSFYDEVNSIIKISEEQGIKVYYSADLFEISKSIKEPCKIGHLYSVIVSSAPLEDATMLWKRFMDILFSLGLLILLSPVFILTSIVIKITSKGPVFFVQKRIGLHKRIFNMYKFRTMVQGAEKMQEHLSELNEMDGPVFKIKDDPRVTKVGHFLRKYSIDELPQLFNVVKGDMSLVGPRPLSLRDYRRLSENEDWVRRRFSVRPGCVCYWQIGGRNDVSFKEWMNLDMKYIDEFSLFTDLMILLKAIPIVLKGTGR
ncbi:hypothetical protein JCM12298_19260 [Desulfothermus naphthae]